MMRDVWNLVAVVAVGGVGHVDGLLEGVLPAEGQLKCANRAERGGGRYVDALDAYAADVEHRPAELLSFGVGYNFVGDEIQVCVGAETETAKQSTTVIFENQCPGIVLGDFLGVEPRIAHVGVIEVVECRHAERALVESPQLE